MKQHTKNHPDLKQLWLSALILIMLFCQSAVVFAEENTTLSEGYQVTFQTDGHAAIDLYYTKDYTAPNETNVTSAVARSADGALDITGDGQVNFKVRVESGYELLSITADQNYKNLKDSADTGAENTYRLTKITGNVIVTIQTQKQLDTMGTASDIVINEIESNGDTTDWVEIYNKGTAPVDISGWYITDDNTSRLENKKTTPLPEGTVLNPGEFFVFDQLVHFDFGLGAPDEVNLFDRTQTLVEKYSWSAHAAVTYARIPDGTGAITESAASTKGSSNGTQEAVKPTFPHAISWPGSDEVTTYDDSISMFQSDSSGLDFYNGQLYCINNKKGTFWVMDVHKDGSLDYAAGFTPAGKNLAFRADSQNPSASNPDAEGITVDRFGNAYAAVERDNNNKNVNYNVILQFNPWEKSSTVVASQEWDITHLLPDVPANAGIEAVEWVPYQELEGKLLDQNTGKAFHFANYPQAAAEGVFFAALENNGHVYALILNKDSSAIVIADIDPGIGGAMALDYDTYEKILWVGADDGYGNVSAQIRFQENTSPSITLVNPPAGMDITRNNEGMAIADPEYTVNGLHPVYHFMDGINTGVLTISYLNCDHQAPVHTHTEVSIPQIAPTCTQTGFTAGIQCSECSEWILPQTEIPALGHADENGDNLCDVCGAQLSSSEISGTDDSAAETKPSDETKPSNGTKPSTGTNPSDGTKPSAGTNPSDGAKPSDSMKPSTDKLPSDQTVSTGDSSTQGIWIFLLLLSIAGIGTIAVRSHMDHRSRTSHHSKKTN